MPRLIFNAKTLKLCAARSSSRPKPNKPRRLDTLSNVLSDVLWVKAEVSPFAQDIRSTPKEQTSIRRARMSVSC